MNDALNQASSKMEKAIESLRSNLSSIRTGRANPTILDKVNVEYYGSPTPINQMASIQVNEGRQLIIKPFDKTILKEMEKAINMSDIGLACQNDGDVLRINVPSLTEEKRKELTKEASKCGEEAKIAIRNIRRDANDLAKKDSELTDDEKKRMQDKIQELTDKYTKIIDQIVDEKSKDIMAI